MASPFAKAEKSIPVTLVTRGEVADLLGPGAELIALAASPHDHAPGDICVACAARGDIRTLLFDVLQQARSTGIWPARVVVDATALADPRAAIERLEAGAQPAFGLRDHTVLGSFYLARVI